MIHNLKISQKQMEYIKAGVSHFCTITDCIGSQPFNYARISDLESNLIAEIINVKHFTCVADIIGHEIFQHTISSDDVKEEITNDIYNLFSVNNKVCALRLRNVYNDANQREEISLYVITELLFWSILIFNNLPLKKKMFTWKLEKDAEKRFHLERIKTTALLSALKGEQEVKHCINYIASIYKDNPHGDPDILTLLGIWRMYPLDVTSIIDDMRRNLVVELCNQINEITHAHESKKYFAIREIGYEIHNIPEMIRNRNDWR